MLQQTPIFHKHAVKRSHLPVAVDKHSGPEKPSAQRKHKQKEMFKTFVVFCVLLQNVSLCWRFFRLQFL